MLALALQYQASDMVLSTVQIFMLLVQLNHEKQGVIPQSPAHVKDALSVDNQDSDNIQKAQTLIHTLLIQFVWIKTMVQL